MMTASLVTPGLAPEPSLPQFKAAFLEPVLIAGAALFWVLALPVVAVSLMAVKIWEVLVALFMGQAVRPNPLILRHGPMRSITARQIQKTAQV